jgi:D-alanyl-D-alanine carboxypeptidase
MHRRRFMHVRRSTLGFAAPLIAVVLMGLAPALPDTPAGKRGAALVAALGAGDAEAMRSFCTENYARSALEQRSAAERAKGMQRALADLEHGTLARVTPTGELGIELVFKAEKRDLWLSFTLELEAAPPHGLLGMRIRADDQPPEPPPGLPGSAPGAAGEAQGPLSEPAALAALAADAERRAAAGEFSGVLLVARDGEPVLSRALGIAERSFGAPVTMETRFNVGSINKIFTQTVMRQLAQEGKVDLSAPLVRALPDYPDPEVAKKITLQQLLDHTSGLGDIFGPRFAETAKTRLRTLADYLPLFAGQPLLFKPGSEQRYSNAGYIVLGLVIERVTGKSYDDAVRERVFTPAGMTRTGAVAGDDPAPGVAVGYTRESPDAGAPRPGSPLRSNVYLRPARGSSAGGGYSTAGDLLRFARALRQGRLLESSPWQSEGGLGIAGGAPGINAALEDDWRSGYTIVVLSNLDPPSAVNLAASARKLLARVERPAHAAGAAGHP